MSSYKRQDSIESSSVGCRNVVLYHSDTAVISVEQGTTLGLAKLLYESVSGLGEIIGLRQRKNSSSLACIITQDQTVLTEREYDIILNGRTIEKRLDKDSVFCQDKNVNTIISLKPDAQIWPAYSFSTPSAVIWDKNIVGSIAEQTKVSWNKQKEKDEELTTEIRQDLLKNSLRYGNSNEESADIRVVSPSVSSSPSIVDVESPGGSYQDSQNNRVEQSRSYKRKWQCFYCKKMFACRSAYDNHERTHTGEKPFECKVCGRCFGHQGNLKQHLHIHREVKPHVCDVCGRGFTRSNRLRDHKRSHQYELYMHTKLQWTTTAQKMTGGNREELSPVPSSAFEESATSDDNPETS